MLGRGSIRLPHWDYFADGAYFLSASREMVAKEGKK